MREGGRLSAWALACSALVLQGCLATGGGKSGSSEGGFGKVAVQSLACVGGGAVGVYAAKALAQAEGKRSRLSAAEIAKREKGYLIGLALIGCAGAAALAGTAYAKLSESGKRAREEELRAAAASAQPRTYRDPENPQLVGTVTPQPTYAESGRECRDVVDNLADAGKGEPIVVKFCRTPPSGGWAQATA